MTAIDRASLPQRMDVVVLNDHAACEGGAGKVALMQAEALAARGHRVTLLAAQATIEDPGRPGWMEGSLLPTLVTGQWDIGKDPRRATAACRGLWNVSAARALADLLAARDPALTIVLLHSWNKALSASVVRAARARDFATVCVAHDFSVVCPNGGLYNYRTQSLCTLRPMSGACLRTDCDKHSYAQKMWRVGRQLTQRHAAGIPGALDAVIFVSRHSRATAGHLLPTGPEQYVLLNPIEPIPTASPVDVSRNRDFVFVGRLSPEKGAFLFAEAAEDAGVETTFIGDGDQRRELEHRHTRARITGWLGADAVVDELHKARALVLPSLWHETFGLVVYEAAALGIPSIVPAQSAAAEFVRDGVNGLTFDRGNRHALAGCLRRLDHDPAFAARLGAQARADFLRLDLSAASHARRLESILRDVLSRRRTKRPHGCVPGTPESHT